MKKYLNCYRENRQRLLQLFAWPSRLLVHWNVARRSGKKYARSDRISRWRSATGRLPGPGATSNFIVRWIPRL